MLRIVKIGLMTALSAAACAGVAGGPANTGISEKKFIAVMVDLGAAASTEKPLVLQKHGVTDKQLRAFIKAYEDHPRALGVIFDSIQTALDRGKEHIK